MEKSLLTRSFLLAVLFLVCINFSSFGAAISFSGASGGNWNVASNWSGNALPTSADDVTISGKTVNVVSGDNVAAGSVIIENSGTATVGTLNILSGGTLTISSTTVTAVFLKIRGGVVNNQGTLNVSIKSGSTSYTVSLQNTTGGSTKMPSTLINSGTLTIDASAGGTTATCISLSQTDAGVQPTFTTGGTINLIPNNVSTAFAIDVTASDALINGSGTLSAGTVGTPLSATLIRIAGSNFSLTIDQNVTVNYIGSSSASYGILIQPTTSGSSTFVNKGTLNLSGTITNPIHLIGNSLTAKFDNQGKINGTGAPASSSSGLITFQQATCTMTNSGTINFNPTTDGAVIRAFSASAGGSFSNSGTITVGSGTALTNAIILGDSKTTLTNTGTISIGSGNITGTTGTNNATFNNNTNGTLNLTNTTANAILIGNTALSLINGGGTITTGATTNAVIIKTGTPGATFTSGVFSPGGDGNGKINLTNSVSLGGTLKINVTGVTTAGTDYDQIVGSYASTDINISGSTLALTMNALTPADGTSITIINYSSNAGCTVTGTFGSVTGLATGWSVVYTATSVQLKFTKITPTVTVSVGTYTYNGSAQGPSTLSSPSSPQASSITYSYSGTGSTTYGPTSTMPTNAGTYTVTATVNSDSYYNSASSGAVSFSINKATPTLTVSNTPVTYDGSAHSATASASGGGTVSNILTGGAANQTTAGTYTVTADIAVSTNYNAATGVTATNSFVINKATQTITFGALPTGKTIGNSDFPPGATSTTSSVNAISYSTSDATVASIVLNQIHIVGVGTCTIYADQASSTNYNAATQVSQSVTIAARPVIILGSNATSADLTNPVADISVPANADLTIGATRTVHNITIERGGKVTLNDGYSLIVNDININSDGNGTGTFVDKNTTNSNGLTVNGTTKVQQYLTTGRNWYVSSPVSGASSAVFNAAAASNINKLYWYNETQGSSASLNWPQITDNSTSLAVTKGYVANVDASLLAATNGVTFTGGSLNTGDITTGTNGVPTLSYSSSQAKSGFNLVGNPYPSYLNWNTVSKTNLASNTMWYRTKVSGTYYFYTYNSVDGAAGIGISVPADVTNLIPPMQAFWVRAAGSGASLTFHNTDRAHKDVTNNLLRTKAQISSTMQVARLQVSNGVNSDETVLYTYPDASNQYDSYDSPKMTNANAAIPEIYTTVSNENLVINGMNSIPYDTEIPLGFTTGQAGSNFSIKASQLANFDSGTPLILKDYLDPNNPVITDLSDGSSYSFSSAITTNNTSRFALIFKAPSVATGINFESNSNVWISTRNGEIMINGTLGSGARLEVFNAIGQKVISKNLNKSNVQQNNSLVAGAYLIKVTNEGKSVIKKIIID